jgi:hypothetical protein
MVGAPRAAPVVDAPPASEAPTTAEVFDETIAGGHFTLTPDVPTRRHDEPHTAKRSWGLLDLQQGSLLRDLVTRSGGALSVAALLRQAHSVRWTTGS